MLLPLVQPSFACNIKLKNLEIYIWHVPLEELGKLDVYKHIACPHHSYNIQPSYPELGSEIADQMHDLKPSLLRRHSGR